LIQFIHGGCQQDITVPEHIKGVWETSTPKFAGPYLEFTGDSLIFGIGKGEYTAHSIQKIKVKHENSGIVYTFHYNDSEGEK